MRVIPKPDDEPKEVFLTCISRVNNVTLKTRLESIADDIRDAADEYDDNATAHRWFLIDQHDDVAGVITKEEMKRVYEYRMVDKNQPGREFYEKLIASAPHSKCPLCGQRDVSDLDHYLPKSLYPSLSVVPFNLVPVCSKCNKAKLDEAPEHNEEQTLHPYYDDVSDVQWLFAEVEEVIPSSFRFYVNAPEEWNEVLKERVEYHFEGFSLSELYTIEASTLLAEINYRITEIFNKAGSVSLSEYLNEEYESRRNNNLNSWQTAMYQAMASSDWFCNGEFFDD